MSNKIIFETNVVSVGSQAESFLSDSNLIVLFGYNAPESLADYCYIIKVENVIEPITTGMQLVIGDTPYPITAVGDLVTKNLSDLGHITINFDGSTTADLPGTLCVKKEKEVSINVGTTLSITK